MKRPPGMPSWIPDACIIDGRDLTSDDPEVHAAAVKRVLDAIRAKVKITLDPPEIRYPPDH